MAVLNQEAETVKEPVIVTDEAREKKNAAARKHAEKVRNAKKADYEASLKLRDTLVKSGQFAALPKETQDWILAKCVDPALAASGVTTTTSIFTQLFGPGAKVGDKITLKAAVEKLNYRVGFKDLNAKCKQWADKGIIVECNLNKDKMLESIYEIKQLASA